jgi:hypothetical protein
LPVPAGPNTITWSDELIASISSRWLSVDGTMPEVVFLAAPLYVVARLVVAVFFGACFLDACFTTIRSPLRLIGVR